MNIREIDEWRRSMDCGPILRYLARTPDEECPESDLVEVFSKASSARIVYDSCMELVGKGFLRVIVRPVQGMDRTQRFYSITKPKGTSLARLLDT
ncbi:MAG TPA: hypothetical protein VFH06_05155 [Candidatus Saccharimonadales bacterium]|nr:hypothetical protein [Candidatus Saccharimonadales bacterium]